MTKRLHHDVRLGRKPAARKVKVKLTDFVDVKYILPKVPKGDFGHFNVLPPKEWGVYGNDKLGDCVIARAQHGHDLWQRANGWPGGLFNEQTAIANYSAVTGYRPGDDSTDQGTDPEAMAAYHRKTGIIDIHGNRHFIGAYAQLRPGDFDQYLVAAYLFGAPSVCWGGFMDYMMDQFNAGKPWDYKRGGNDEGGHDTLGAGRKGRYGAAVTWGEVQPFTRRIYYYKSDMALAYIAPEWLNGTGRTPDGFDAVALQQALAAVTGRKVQEPDPGVVVVPT
jgi:hypothetical protein